MLSKIRTLLIAGVVALFAVILTGGMASATVAADHTSFGAQGRAAGLTANQISTLQATADHYLATLGGRQVALNQIDLNGAVLSIALPGEAQPRALTSQSAAQSVHGCAYLYFCAYSVSNFSGSRMDMKACTPHNMPWGSGGSWVNNQTPGTEAAFYRQDGSLIHHTPPAYSENPQADWLPVYTVVPC